MTNFARIAVAATTLALAGGAASADHLNIELSGARYVGSTITFPSIKIDKPGYLVIHAVENGEPVIPASIGHTMVQPGTSSNVAVRIDESVMRDGQYLAMLHYETNANGMYDFGPANTTDDAPALKPDDTPYMLMFKTPGR